MKEVFLFLVTTFSNHMSWVQTYGLRMLLLKIKNFFHQLMIDFFNQLESNYKNYQTNLTFREENYKGRFLFNVKYFLLLVTYHQSMFYMSNILLKENINSVRVPQFQLNCIYTTTNPLHKNVVKLYCDMNYMWLGNQELELQEGGY